MNDHSGTTRKCPVCGKPYKVYNMTVADQSACPKCVAESNKNYKKNSLKKLINNSHKFLVKGER